MKIEVNGRLDRDLLRLLLVELLDFIITDDYCYMIVEIILVFKLDTFNIWIIDYYSK